MAVLPPRSKRRRDNPTSETPNHSLDSAFDDEGEGDPFGEIHRINGRFISGDKFISHCGEGSVVPGPGWWEDLDVGASDTYISPCSFEAAVAAAAVVCAGVDAVTMGCVVGCDLLAGSDLEGVECAGLTAEERIASCLSSSNSNSPQRPSLDPEVVTDAARGESDSPRPSLSAVSTSVGGSFRSDVVSALESMDVEEISELMTGFLEECNNAIQEQDPTVSAVVTDKMDGTLNRINVSVSREEESICAVQESATLQLQLQQQAQAQAHIVEPADMDSTFSQNIDDTAFTSASTSTSAGHDNKSTSEKVSAAIGQNKSDSCGVVLPSNTIAASSGSLTRSKVGVTATSTSTSGAALGVVTPEMLSSVAANTAVAVTEVHGVKNVFCCIRPPGHHAGRFGSTRGCSNNGFCLLNNVAIGAYYARIKYGLRRFAVVDIDAHFGNGTAEIFEGDPHAFYSSVHLQYDGPKDFFFPSSSCCLLGADERHPNRVLVNVYPTVRAGNPLFKSGKPRSRSGFRISFEDIIMPALKAFKPDIIFISAGFDGASTDPIGGQVGLKPIDFHWMAERIQVVADEVCGGRVVSVLEGGYDVSKAADGLATCAEAHVLALAGRGYR